MQCLQPSGRGRLCSPAPAHTAPHAPPPAAASRTAAHPCVPQPSTHQRVHMPLPHTTHSPASHVRCAASPTSGPGGEQQQVDVHKIFDEAVIVVKAGDGGRGEVVEATKGRWVDNFKYKPGGSLPKRMWLPASDPADGADGADVLMVCDPSLDSLLHLHKRREYAGVRGANGNPAVGSGGPKRNRDLKKASTPPLEIRVPPGTVVKRKATGQVLGELVQPGQRLLVAKGGKGGSGVRAPSREVRIKTNRREMKRAEELGGEVIAVADVNWKDDARGLAGQQLSLQLLLRVVADIGIVGYPNAGKSSLLAALTRAAPAIAPYPFTTLMPNLGVMGAGGGPLLADLPGLIDGAHAGRGLGRVFLRHLRRTRCLLHVVDAAAADPATDYWAVREELRLYNPDYCARPHVVALNKMDLEDAGELRHEVAAEVAAAAQRLQRENREAGVMCSVPASVVAVSAVSGEGVTRLREALEAVLRDPAMRVEGLVVDVAAGASSVVDVGEPGGGAGGGRDRGASSVEASREGEEWASDEGEGEYGEGEYAEEDEEQQGEVRAWGEEDDEEEPGAVAADDPDKWLLDLSEEELLALERE